MSGDDRIKIITLGEFGVGKTNLIRAAAGQEFEPKRPAKFDGQCFESQIQYEDKLYKYYILDTETTEQYHAITKQYLKDSQIILFVCSINDRESFEKIDDWIKLVADLIGTDGFIVSLVVTKSDLKDKGGVVEEKEIEEKAKKYGVKFKITSALNDAEGFRNFLYELLGDYIYYYKCNPEPIKIGQKEGKNNNKKKCG